MNKKAKQILNILQVAGVRDDQLISSLLSIVDKKEATEFLDLLDKKAKSSVDCRVMQQGGYKTILIDPPWQQKMSGKYKVRKHKNENLDYPTMTIEQLKKLPVNDLAATGCHLWMWTTNQFLESGLLLMKHWGFKYLSPITWVKPSGCGNWFVQTTQTMLFGYKEKCIFEKARYKPTHFFAPNPQYIGNKHSQKPAESYELIESISPEPRLELFARAKRQNWFVWGNEVESDISLAV